MSDFLSLRKFDPSTIRDYSTILFVGGRRVGKSYCMRDFLYHLRKKVYDATIFSGTIDPDHRWEKYMPPDLVHYCLEEFPVDDMVNSLRTQEKRKILAEEFGVECPPSIMVFEDIEHLTPPIWKHQSMKALMHNGRWSRCYCYIAFQYLMEVKKAIRGAFDYAVFCMEPSASNRKAIWEQFGGIVPRLGDFERIFMECTRDDRVMVIDCRAKSYQIRNTIFWYKAKDRGFFKMGHPDSWTPHGSRGDESEDEEDKNAGGGELPPKKGGDSKLKVELLGDEGGEWGDDGEWKDGGEQSKKKHKKKKSKQTM